LLGVGEGCTRLSFSDREHVVVVFDVGAEKEHAAIILSDLRKSHYFGKKLARTFEILHFQNEMPDAFDFE
jgi:hypothetical protein